MALFTEKQIQNNQLAQINLKELAKGESVTFYAGSIADRNSAEYGDFKVVEGLNLDANAGSIDALVDSASGAAFIPNTMLLNMIEEGKLAAGNLYRIEKAWDRDEKFSNGKKAKGFGYNVFELGADQDTKVRLRDAFMEAKSGNKTEEL